MAFNKDNQSDSGNNANAVKDNPTGYLNFYIPKKDGSRKKLGAIGLKDSNIDQKHLREWLDADENNVAILLSALILEYTAVNSAPAEFALPGFGL